MMNTLIQIRRWVMQPKVWRFVGLVSAAIGLLCFALSSSFNDLFGDWNSLKISLYCLYTFIISLMTLFPKIWQHSTSHWFKVTAKVLVITLTALYSFYFDKMVKGKPDVYSLISCAAFTIMLLSLSLQTRCGFEKELMVFFVGYFIIQFMKIKEPFVILGACFCFFILCVYSYCRNRNDVIEAGSHSPQLASAIDNENPTSLQEENPDVIVDPHSPQLTRTDIGISSMLEKLSDYVKALRQENSPAIEMLMEESKDYLSDDFRFSGFNVSEDTDFIIMALPTETIDNIHKTAKLMVSAGFKREFSDMYSSSRRECLVESLSRVGFKKLSIEDLQMLSWEEIKDEIVRWVKASNVALNILLPVERKLCDRVFFGFSSTADLSFMDVCRESTLQLLNFVDVIAIGSGSPERLLMALEVFDTMRDLIIPELKSLFRDQYSGSLQNEVTTICKRLGASIRGIFTELANHIRENSIEIVHHFGVHPITSYVMDYLCAASVSRKTLEQVFERGYGDPLKEYPKIEDRVHSSSDLSVQMGFIIDLIESKLIAALKAPPSNLSLDIDLLESMLRSTFKVPPFDSDLNFLISNDDYIVQRAKESELGAILGDDWFKNHVSKSRILVKSRKLKQEIEQAKYWTSILKGRVFKKAPY